LRTEERGILLWGITFPDTFLRTEERGILLWGYFFEGESRENYFL